MNNILVIAFFNFPTFEFYFHIKSGETAVNGRFGKLKGITKKMDKQFNLIGLIVVLGLVFGFFCAMSATPQNMAILNALHRVFMQVVFGG